MHFKYRWSPPCCPLRFLDHVIDGDVIDFAALVAAKLVPSSAKRAKVFLCGKLEKKVSVSGLGVTKDARSAIEALGGSVTMPEAPASA